MWDSGQRSRLDKMRDAIRSITTYHQMSPPTTSGRHLPPEFTTYHQWSPPTTRGHHLPPEVQVLRGGRRGADWEVQEEEEEAVQFAALDHLYRLDT